MQHTMMSVFKPNVRSVPNRLSFNSKAFQEFVHALADQTLREQQHYTRSIIEANVDALFITDPHGIISTVNQQMIEITGFARSELIGLPCADLFTDAASAGAAFEKALADGRVSDEELTVKARSGTEILVSYNAATVYDRRENLVGIFVTVRDATERKRVAQDLKAKSLELEHANRTKSEFLATMSHELRTPLNAIMGFSEALQHGIVGNMCDKQKEYIQHIYDSGQHLLELINDMLDLSKVEAGMLQLDLEAADPGEILSNAFSDFIKNTSEHQIHFELEVGPGLVCAQLDLRKTKQIIDHMLSNAEKFSAPDGNVCMQAHIVPRSSVGKLVGKGPVHGCAVAASDFSEFIQITVHDSGIGIAQQNLPRLFQSFSQIDSGLDRRFEGTGLGLSLVRQLTELHGGAVAVASLESIGTSFAVWLPLRTRASAMPIKTALPHKIDSCIKQLPVHCGLKD